MSVTFVPRKRPDSVDCCGELSKPAKYSQSAERPTTKPKKRLPFASIEPTTIPEKSRTTTITNSISHAVRRRQGDGYSTGDDLPSWTR